MSRIDSARSYQPSADEEGVEKSSGDFSNEQTGIYDAQDWFKHVADQADDRDRPTVEESFMQVDNVVELNRNLDIHAAQERALTAAGRSTPRVGSSTRGKKQQSKPKKRGFFERIASWFSRKKV